MLIIKRFRSNWKVNLLKRDNNRAILITPFFFNSFFSVHNGKEFQTIKIENNMQNFKLGEFCFTKKIAKFKNGKK